MQTDVLDEAALKQFVDDIGPATKELIVHFITDMRDKVGELSGISDEADITSLAIHAHSLKGLSRTCGMTGISDAAYELEIACRESAPERAMMHYAEIQEQIEPAIIALISFVDKHT